MGFVRIVLVALSLFAFAQAPASDVTLPNPGKDPRTLQGRQLSVTVSQSALNAAPGAAVELLADVVPKPKMHVYAPEQKGGYIRIELSLDDQPGVIEEAPVFPKAADYHFAPLNETFKVYDAPFRIQQPIKIASTADLRKRAAANDTLTLTGTLRYQACDDSVCYRPDQIKVSWNLALQPASR